MNFIDSIKEKVKKNLKRIVLPESKEDRMYLAAEKLLKENLVKELIFVGEKDFIIKKAQELNVSDIIEKIRIYDIETFERLEEFGDEFYELRKHKGISKEEAMNSIKNELFFGAMLVRKGLADGMVAGAMNETANVVRSGLYIIGTKEGINTVSSFFVMILPDKNIGEEGILFFADSAVVINPTASQLADIGISTAESMKSLLGKEPRIAFLSFSTKGSASHPLVDKVVNALNIAREKRPDLKMDGEFQLDSALIERVARKKVKTESEVAGKANILIFPDLNSGNIGYKLTQYLGKAMAVGPILQGLKKPVNDLSRGCLVDDIVGVVCITQLQAD